MPWEQTQQSPHLLGIHILKGETSIARVPIRTLETNKHAELLDDAAETSVGSGIRATFLALVGHIIKSISGTADLNSTFTSCQSCISFSFCLQDVTGIHGVACPHHNTVSGPLHRVA